MITLDECKKILNEEDISYTTEEIKEIRSFLYQLASFQLECENELN